MHVCSSLVRSSDALFKIELILVPDSLILYIFLLKIKIKMYWGDITDISVYKGVTGAQYLMSLSHNDEDYTLIT